MKRRLVYLLNGALVTGGIAAFIACSSNERPPVTADDPIDSGFVQVKDDGSATVGDGIVISGLDDGGVSFGDNGLVACGTQAPDHLVTLTNPTDEVISFTAKLTSGDKFYKLTPESGSVAAHDKSTIQIVATPLPLASDVVTDLYAGTLQITTADGKPSTNIRLHQTAQGALITSTLGGAGLDLGAVRVNKTGTVQFSMTNTGNVGVTASFELGTAVFKIDGNQLGTASIGPGETVSKTVTLTPTDSVPYTDTLAVSFNSGTVQCKTPPAGVTIKGSGTTSVGVSPGTLDFGLVDCGKSTPFQTVTISSATDTDFTPVLVKGESGVSPYTLADNTGVAVTVGNSIHLAADGTYTMRVIPKAVPSVQSTSDNALGDTLRITTTVGTDTPHNVTLKETARGTIFTLTPLSLTFSGGSTSPGGSVTATSNPITLTNVGNQTGSYVLHPSQFTLTVDNGTLASPPAAVTSVQALVIGTQPNYNGTTNGSLTVSAGPNTVMCADLPPLMPIIMNNPNSPPPTP